VQELQELQEQQEDKQEPLESVLLDLLWQLREKQASEDWAKPLVDQVEH
jgi:hypothetical protein